MTLAFIIGSFLVMYLGHEAGHVAAALLVGWKIERVHVHPLGGLGIGYDTRKLGQWLPYVALSGPVMSLLLALIGLSFMPGVYAFTFMVVNLAMLGAQFLPIKGSDGWVFVCALRQRKEAT